MIENEARSAIRGAFERAHVSSVSGFEARMQTALLRAAPAQSVSRRPHLRERLAILAVVVAAVAVVAALIGPRIYTRSQQPAVVASPPALAPSPSPNPNACRLPVVVDFLTVGASPYAAGFIDVATGKFSAATDVSFADLAAVTDGATISATGGVYDPVLMRWLPSGVLSPDQLSYLYVTIKGSASTLHIFDVVHHTDRAVWTLQGVVTTPTGWKDDGIYAFTDDLSGSSAPPRYWRVDPQSGNATEIDRATFNPYLSLFAGATVTGQPAGLTYPGQWGTSGVDPERMIYRIGNLDTKHTYFVIIDGKRTDIYTGVANDKKDFDPFNVVYDGSFLWFSNADAKYLWSWTAATGLMRHAIQLPGVPFTGKRPAGYTIAGPCV